MSKIDKEAAKRHNKALELVRSDKELTMDERWYILENYHEGATNLNSLAGAFFTPVGLAKDFCIEIHSNSTIDLCAGIGCLSFVAFARGWLEIGQMTCVELNPEYVEVGRRLLPEATWICGDITDEALMKSLGRFGQAIGNPPFGRVKSGSTAWAGYTGSEFEYKAIAVASRIADAGTFIIPQMSAGFEYSGMREHKSDIRSDKLNKFTQQTGIELGVSCGIDCSFHIGDWKGVAPKVEIVDCWFEPLQSEPTAPFDLPEIDIVHQ